MTNKALNLKYFDLLKVHNILSNKIKDHFPNLVGLHNASFLMATYDIAARMVHTNYKSYNDELRIVELVQQRFRYSIDLALKYKIALFFLSKGFTYFKIFYKIYLLLNLIVRKIYGK